MPRSQHVAAPTRPAARGSRCAGSEARRSAGRSAAVAVLLGVLAVSSPAPAQPAASAPADIARISVRLEPPGLIRPGDPTVRRLVVTAYRENDPAGRPVTSGIQWLAFPAGSVRIDNDGLVERTADGPAWILVRYAGRQAAIQIAAPLPASQPAPPPKPRDPHELIRQAEPMLSHVGPTFINAAALLAPDTWPRFFGEGETQQTAAALLGAFADARPARVILGPYELADRTESSATLHVPVRVHLKTDALPEESAPLELRLTLKLAGGLLEPDAESATKLAAAIAHIRTTVLAQIDGELRAAEQTAAAGELAQLDAAHDAVDRALSLLDTLAAAAPQAAADLEPARRRVETLLARRLPPRWKDAAARFALEAAGDAAYPPSARHAGNTYLLFSDPPTTADEPWRVLYFAAAERPAETPELAESLATGVLRLPTVDEWKMLLRVASQQSDNADLAAARDSLLFGRKEWCRDAAGRLLACGGLTLKLDAGEIRLPALQSTDPAALDAWLDNPLVIQDRADGDAELFAARPILQVFPVPANGESP